MRGLFRFFAPELLYLMSAMQTTLGQRALGRSAGRVLCRRQCKASRHSNVAVRATEYEALHGEVQTIEGRCNSILR